MRENLPARRLARRRGPLGIDGHHDALGAEFVGAFRDEGPPAHGRRIDGNLVGAGTQQLTDVLGRPHAPADRERHETARSRALDNAEDGVAVLVAGRDVEKAELVGACRIISRGRLDGIAGILEVDEVNPFDDAAVLHVEAGDDTDFQHVLIHRPGPLMPPGRDDG